MLILKLFTSNEILKAFIHDFDQFR